MSIDFYLVCHNCKKKIFLCNRHICAERLNIEDLARMLRKHRNCGCLGILDDNALANLELPMPGYKEDMDSESYKLRCIYYHEEKLDEED